MKSKVVEGALKGVLFAIFMIASQPFHPREGLIHELATFFTSVPLWMAAIVFPYSLTPLAEGGVIILYFLLLGAIIGAAFGEKPIWGWLLVLMLAIHHYVIDQRVGREMGEIVQGILNYFS